jgi:tetratricopeptide (TPR) repeat protein
VSAGDSGAAGNAISGGIFFGPVLQGRDIQATFLLRGAAPLALAELPAPTAGFTGREEELALVAGALDPAAGSEVVMVSAVAGMAGIGKTALAIEAAHAAIRCGWFRGALFINLHGYDDIPVEPGHALDALLRATGIPAEYIPPDAEARAALYRSILAEATSPLLVVIDNASSEAQVRPLLPGAGPHRVLVTSRHTLAGLDARLVDVAVLTEQDGVQLLDTVVRAARPDDNRVSASREQALRITTACGGLPLALRITAALLKADPMLTAAELADELDLESERLERLSYDDGSGAGNQWSVAAAFELSYRRLGADLARVFRLLTAEPGPSISAAAAAALAGSPRGKIRKDLAELARGHLCEAAPGSPKRWRMHDLIRLYARQRADAHAEADDRRLAEDRLLQYYLTVSYAADQCLRGGDPAGMTGEFTDRGGALDWLDANRHSLVPAVRMAADTGRDQVAVQLPLVLAEYFELRRLFDDWQSVTAVSVAVAGRVGDRAREAAALITLGNVLRHARQFEKAAAACRGAIAISSQIGDRTAVAGALNNMATALHETGRFDESIAAQRENLAICRETGDRDGEAKALNNMGLALRRTSRIDEAIKAHEEAAGIYRQIGDRRREGRALNNLGLAFQQAERYEEALAAYNDDLVICRETGDRWGEATTLKNLGVVLYATTQFGEAISAFQDAATIYRETAEEHGLGGALTNLGLALEETGRPAEAIPAYREAALLYRELGDQDAETRVNALLDRASSALT